MSKFDKTQAPYYDHGEEELAKNYYQLLARPGRVAQAREFSTMQTILQGIIKSLGDSIMSNGDIVEGFQVIPSTDKKSVTVTSGRVYIDGIVFTLKEDVVVGIKGVGSELIGVKIDDTVVTESNDTNLRDPAQGYDNYSQAGCDRIKRTLNVVVNDPEAVTISILQDGEVTVENLSPNYDKIEKTLARRTYDESGSYVVEGLKSHSEDIPNDSSNYNVVVESGKAYVLGYELKLPAARRLKNSRSTTTISININPTYTSGNKLYSLDSNPFVESIVQLKGNIEHTENQVLTSNTDSVELSMKEVLDITKIKQGEKEFVKNTDYMLQRISGTTYYAVVWLGKESPNPGQSYTVTYTYNKEFEQGDDKDYKLLTNYSGCYVEFTDSGAKPINGTQMTITFNQYLARRDLLYIDQYGNLTIINGAPDEVGYEVAPIAPVNTLALAEIYNPPNGQANPTIDSLKIEVNNIGLTRFTMYDIQKILDRVKKTEYNQAFLSLNDDARNVNTINSKKGILTDPMVDFSRVDLYYNINSSTGEKLDPSKSVYNMALNLDLGYAYLPVTVNNYNFNGTSSNTAYQYSRLITLKPTGENVVLDQPNATKSFLVNPYSVYPQLPDIAVTPAVDSWIENNIIEIPVSLTNSKIVKVNTSFVYKTNITGHYVPGNSTMVSSSTSSSSATTGYTNIGSTTSTSTNTSLASENAITYMRQIELTVEGKYFSEGLDNIRCMFDGAIVPLTPAPGTSPGTIEGSLKADENGYVKGTFTIPEKVRTGSREIKLYSDTKVNGYKNEAHTIFQSSGVSRTYQRTITTVTTVLLQREVTTTETTTEYYVDPVAQTFLLDRTTVLKGIDLYFEYKPPVDVPVVLEIKGVKDGNITSTIYARKSLSASQVVVSNDASKPTRFNFDDPVVLENNTFYAFTVRSTSDKYRLWVSELGGTDVLTKKTILKNSYLTGVMMSSSNNSSWTVHQTTDIKFRLIEDVYSNSGTIIYNPIPVDNITRIDLQADYIELDGTSVKWYYSINGGENYYSVSPGSLRELKDIATSVIFKVELYNNSNTNITPFIASDSILLVGSSYNLSGEYVGVNVIGMDSYKNVTLVMNAYTPSGTTLTPYFSHNDGTTLTALSLDESQTKSLGGGWRELMYTGSIPSNGSSTQCRLFIKATSSSSKYTPEFSSIRVIMD